LAVPHGQGRRYRLGSSRHCVGTGQETARDSALNIGEGKGVGIVTLWRPSVAATTMRNLFNRTHFP
jgi:hypothetical protein